MRRLLSVFVILAGGLTGGLAATGASAQGPAMFDPDDFGKIVIQPRQAAGSPGGFTLEQAFGDYQNEPIVEYGEDSPAVRLGRPIGRLDTLYSDGSSGFCTAFIVDDKHILTNHHCIPGMQGDPTGADSGVQAAQFVAGYIQPGRPINADKYSVSPQIVETNRELDYTVLRVFGNPSTKYGIMELANANPENSEFLWIIGHPQGQSQHISREGCAAASPAISDEGKLVHSCDTLTGNSGSPVIRISDKRVVGLHHAGDNRTGYNMAIPMTRILAISRVLRAAPGEERTPAPPEPLPVVTTPELSACEVLWQEAKTLGCGGYEAFLAQCGDHTFSVMAKAMTRRECSAETAAVTPATPTTPVVTPEAPVAEPAAEPVSTAPEVVNPAPTHDPNADVVVVKAGGGGDYRSLADAVARAKPGATIEVHPGTYTQGIDVTKPLDIVGVGRRSEIILKVAGDNAIRWEADEGLIKGLTIRQDGGQFFGVDVVAGSVTIEGNDMSSRGLSILVLRTNVDAMVRDNEIHGGNEGGVFAFDNGKGTVRDNVFYGNTFSAIEIRGGAELLVKNNTVRDGNGNGIYVNEGGRGRIDGNKVFGNRRVGISLNGADNPTIVGNVVRDGQEGGILVTGGSLATISGNTIYGNTFSGIEINGGADPWVKGNTIRNGQQVGMFILDGGKGVIENNDIYGNAFSGITVQGGSTPIVRRNRITRNVDYGIEILAEGRGTYENNDMVGNEKSAFFVADDAGSISRRGNKE